jgi:hypothetical protein
LPDQESDFDDSEASVNEKRLKEVLDTFKYELLEEVNQISMTIAKEEIEE